MAAKELNTDSGSETEVQDKLLSASFGRWLTSIERSVSLKTASPLKDKAVGNTVRVTAWAHFSLGLIILGADIFYRNELTATHLICGLIVLLLGILPLIMTWTGRIYSSAIVLCVLVTTSITWLAAGNGGISNPISLLLVLPAFWGWLMFSIKGSVPIAALTLTEIAFLTHKSISSDLSIDDYSFIGLGTSSLTGVVFVLLLFSGVISGVVSWYSTREHEAELIRGRDEARRANKEKSEFIASIAHEIRTPLTGLMGMLELLSKEMLTDDQAEMASTARASSRNILNLINDLLDLSKMEIGELRLVQEPVNIGHLFDQTAREFRSSAEDKGLHFRVMRPETDFWILIDPLRFRQIMSNYITNAIKFTDRGGIDLRLSCDALENGDIRLVLAVEDTGPGIPSNLSRKIFGRFVQVDKTQRANHAGTGIGLAIVSDLAKLQDGDVWVESIEGRGSTFFFESVFKRTSAMDMPHNLSPASQARSGVTILIADDSVGNQRVLTRVLRGLGYQTISVENGADAVLAVAGKSIDAVLMDLNMPIKDGPTALAEIRKMPMPLCNIPVIGLSADNSEGDIKRWTDAGVDGFVPKPVDFATLDLSIRRVIGMHRPAGHSDVVEVSD